MKKLIALLLVFIMTFSLSACGLSDEEKAKVENVDNMILSMSEISLSSKSDLDNIRKSIDELGDLKKHLENLDKFDGMVTDYQKLVTDEAAAIDKEIDAVSTVNKDNLLDVENARVHYNESNSDVKAAVKNKEKLETAVAKAKEVKKGQREEAKKLLKTFNVKYDEVRGITHYFPKCRPKYINTRNFALPYMAKSDIGYTLFLEFNYYGDDWIFFKNILYLADGERFSQKINYFDISHEVVYGGVCETADIVIDKDSAEKLLTLANSKKAIVRFSGDEYCYDLVLSATDKKAIKDMVNAYLILCE